MSTPTRRRWFQFELVDLFIGLTLTAVGVGGFVTAAINNQFGYGFAQIWITFGSIAVIGAGLLSPFRLKAVGLVLGYLLAIPILWFFGLPWSWT